MTQNNSSNNDTPPLTLSITTGLLTLSVHDNLTFDGVEVALNPDLFANISSAANAHHHRRQDSNASVFSVSHSHRRQDSSASVFTQSSVFSIQSIQSPVSVTPNLVQEDSGNAFLKRDAGNVNTAPLSRDVSAGATGGTGGTSTSPHSSILKAGDLIEITVWEQNKNNNHHGHMDGNNNHNHSDIIVNRAAIKLKQHVKQTASSSSSIQGVFHPLAAAESKKSPTQPSSIVLSSSRPPIAPRTTSVSSSIAATPTTSPKHYNQPNLTTSTSPFLLPKWINNNNNHDSKDQIFRGQQSGNNSIDGDSTSSKTAAADNKAQSSIPFPPAVIKTTTTTATSQPPPDLTSSPQHTDDILLFSATSTINKSQSFDNESNNAINASNDESPKPETTTTEDYQRIHQQSQAVLDLISKTHTVKTKFIMSVSDKSLNALKSTGRTQISLLKQVATLYNLSSFDMVTVTKIHKSEEAIVLESVQADHLTITIKDQFISRGELYQFQNYFLQKWIYAGQRLKTNDDMRGYVMEIRNQNQELKSGFLTNDTKITFRSRSARIFWLVQISSEMWDYASPYTGRDGRDGKEASCEIYFDKFISFMKRLFEEWKALDVTHSLTILFFSRSYINSKHSASAETRSMITSSPENSSIYRDTNGRLYEDFYKTIVENVTKATNWDSLVVEVKKAFVTYPYEVGWKISRDNTYSRVPSTAAQGNILEAINIALNVLQRHYVDRDLYRCGNSIVIVSAGNGVFEVDKNLAGITKQRMMDNGIGSDMLSLGLPPLHVAPFFLYKESSASESKDSDFDGWKSFFEIPHWMHLSYVAYDKANRSTGENNVTYANESHQQLRILANGFIVHCNDSEITKPVVNNVEPKKLQIQKHLISGRDFDDILEACRPRNLVDNFGGLPKALVSQMKIFGLIGKDEEFETATNQGWGFLDVGRNRQGSESDDISRSSHSTVSSHFTNTYSSLILSQSPNSNGQTLLSPKLSSFQIQQSRSHEMPLFMLDEKNLRSITSEYDKNVFMPDSLAILQSTRATKDAENSTGALSPKKPQKSSGIGEAIHQYENKSDPNSSVFTLLDSPLMPPAREPRAITRVKKALGSSNLKNSSRPTSFGHLHESVHHHILGNQLDVTQHTVSFPESKAFIDIPTVLSRSMQSSDDNYIEKARKDPFQPSSSPTPKGITTYMSASPPSRKKFHLQAAKIINVNDNKLSQRSHKVKNSASNASTYSRRKQWVLNPFRQEDEDEVLSKRNHNSRRWSHVFPKGEIEFKRQTGPNFKSLCQPAILPVMIDVYPTQEEFNEKYNFTFYDLNLAAMDITYYKTHEDLLMEMVRQRLTQDFQLVPQAVILASRKTSAEDQNSSSRTRGYPGTITPAKSSIEKSYLRRAAKSSASSVDSPAIALSMGHRFQTLQYNPDMDAVRVVAYSRNDASNIGGNKVRYNFQLWQPSSRIYITSSQTFDKYPDEYNWNKLDNLICGDTEKTLSEMFRYRRITFRVIPDSFQDSHGEQEYVKKLQRLIEFLEKLAQKKLDLQIFTRENNESQQDDKRTSIRTSHRLTSFIVHLRKGKRDKYEWMEVVINSILNTAQAFRINFNWLVASSIKIDAQVQLLQRRCSQFNLNLVPAPTTSLHSTMYLHPLIRPVCFKVSSTYKAKLVENALIHKFDFCDDGEITTYPDDVTTFGINVRLDITGMRRRSSFSRMTSAQQYICRTGTLFVRVILDQNDTVAFLCLENRRLIGNNQDLLNITRNLMHRIIEDAKVIDNSDIEGKE